MIIKIQSIALFFSLVILLFYFLFFSFILFVKFPLGKMIGVLSYTGTLVNPSTWSTLMAKPSPSSLYFFPHKYMYIK